MALNYSGLHLAAENYVTRPKSDQPYINRLADTIHGASAYVLPHKVDNKHRQQIEALCGSPQIQRIRSIMAKSHAGFGTSAEAEPSEAEPSAAAIPLTPRQFKSASKQASRNQTVEQQEAAAQLRIEKGEARRNAAEAEGVIAEAKRLSTAKKAAKTPTPKSSAKSGSTTGSFVSAQSGKSGSTVASFVRVKSAKSTEKKVAFTATPRDLAKDFEADDAEALANVGSGGAAAAAPAPTALPAVTATRADRINATILQVEGAAGRIKVVPTSKEGKGAKGFQPAYIGNDGIARGYLSADVTEDQLATMITEFTKVRVKLTDNKAKQDITNFITRIKKDKKSR